MRETEQRVSHAQLVLQSLNPYFAWLPFGMHSLSVSQELPGPTCPGCEMHLGWVLGRQLWAAPLWDGG